MAFMRALLVLSSMSSASGAYTCPSGYADISGTPWCAGTTDESCSVASCCKLTGTLCSSTNVITGNAKCKGGSDVNMFFDLKKSASVVKSGGDDSDFRGTCCSSCSDATCADWRTVKVLVGCGSGKSILGTNGLSSSDCSIPADAKYKEACCADTPAAPTVTGKYCSATNMITGNSKCKGGSDVNMFFDLKKASSTVGSDSDGDFRAACCTSCSEAKCADWQTVKALVACPSGQYINPETTLSSSDCSIPDNDKYKGACCVEPKKCADYSASGDSREAGAAFPQASPLFGTFVAIFMVLVGAHNF